MKKVLIVTYYYPPRLGIGSNRMGGLAKYLRKFGWEAVILTPRLEEGTWVPYGRVVETAFCSSIDRFKRTLGFRKGVGIQKQLGIKNPKSGSFPTCIVKLLKEVAAYPDEFKNWTFDAVKAGLRLIKEEEISMVLSSFGPASMHVAAGRISKLGKIPWVADFRDLWTQSHYYDCTFLRRVFERRLEIKTLKNAVALVTVSKPLADRLRKLHNNKNIFCVTNGFDPEETRDREYDSDKFVISYTGSLYDNKKKMDDLFEAIIELIERSLLYRDDIRLKFYGPFNHSLQNTIKKFGLDDIAVQHGIVKRDESLMEQKKSSVLLIVEWDKVGEEGVYTGKVFEYLSAKRPILSIGKRGGVLEELLIKTHAGVYARTKNEIKEALMLWYEEFKKHGRPDYTGRWEEISKYSHINMASKYAYILNNICKQP